MKWLTWPPRFAGFLLWFAKEVVTSSAAVIHDVLTPEHKSSPVVARCPTRCRTEFETAFLSVLITLTPGTLVLATVTSDDAPRDDGDDRAARAGHARRDGGRARTGSGGRGYELYVHCMYEDDPAAVRRSVRRTETRMLQGIRAEGAPR